MTAIDLIITIIVCGGAAMGWVKKLTGQVASIVGVVLAIVVCRTAGTGLTDAFVSVDGTPSTRLLETMMVYVALGTIVYIAVRLLSRLLSTTVKALHLGPVDRAGGAVFTIFEWLVALSLLLNLWLGFFKDSELRTQHENLTAWVINLGPRVMGSETAQQILSTIHSPKALNQHGDTKGDNTSN